MNKLEAEEYAKQMSYREAVINALAGRAIPYRKATKIKLHELLKIVDTIIDRKVNEVTDGMTCRDCKKWEVCECGKKGHENGTSIGYSIGECKEFEVNEVKGE